MTMRGSCQCGKVAFEVDGELPRNLTRCTCSFCSKRGAQLAYYQPGQFRLLAGDTLGTYRWPTRQVAHHFCLNCGIATHGDSPAFECDGSWDGKTQRIGVIARLFDDLDAEAAEI